MGALGGGDGRFVVSSVGGEDGAFVCVLGGKEGTIGDPRDALSAIGRRNA